MIRQNDNGFALVISYVFHPIFMPTLGLLYLYASGLVKGFHPYVNAELHQENVVVIGITFFFTFILPITGIALLKKTGHVESLHLQNRRDRFLPFSIMGICTYLCFHVLFIKQYFLLDPILAVFLFGCMFSIVGALGITLVWKISVHMIGIGGFIGALFFLSKASHQILLIPILSAIFIAGLIAYSRLSLGAHDKKQLFAGLLLGFFSETFMLLIRDF